MSQINWLEILGWHSEEINDIRFVAYSYLQQGQYETAIIFFEALVILSERSCYDLQTLGALYLQHANPTKALDYLEQAVKIDPSHGPTLLNRAKALLALGYKKQALLQARLLQKHSELAIANQASAILSSFS